MTGKKSKIFRDPIYQIISFDLEKDDTIIKIINSEEFQRLRRIRQLGVSSFTFSSAIHDRLSHSLGVAYQAGLLVDQIRLPEEIEIISTLENRVSINKIELKFLLQVTALLHDIGHGPFSHAFEKVTTIDHEEISKEIIQNENSTIRRILEETKHKKLRPYIVQWIIEILENQFRPAWINQIISSQLDVDRLDYLIRDAYMCGVPYAEFDLKWILRNIEIGKAPDGKECLMINGEKGLHSIESFLISRYHMYEQVYFHKTTRFFECLVERIIRRARELYFRGNIKELQPLYPPLQEFFEKTSDVKNIEKVESYISEFLRLDDFLLTSQIAGWSYSSKDQILKKLCNHFLNREPFKMIKEVKIHQENPDEFGLHKMDQALIIRKAFETEEEFEYFYIEDTSKNVYYKEDYVIKKPEDFMDSSGKETEQKLEQQIYKASIMVSTSKGPKELSLASPLIGSIRETSFQKHRAYIEKSYLNKINI